ncbi:hypothetical protein FZ934_07955 [Rhizobium grahamii]|uniref:Uncharacterized protein n=1 Tax=Rhizobium grahamii TaxID=1120045 RepID=A0A5Q0C943_9HYPH|nr:MULTISPECIES: hypothetical protein [Rhizobium]QFY60371.1 hypothetical protein FZ934_07955 [Rhizobium grahamii]QRM50503.1 hypothetical protein F3Y33_14935 [Rhizobium sp. BG6]
MSHHHQMRLWQYGLAQPGSMYSQVNQDPIFSPLFTALFSPIFGAGTALGIAKVVGAIAVSAITKGIQL